ncbi:FAD-dependent oxidoreductase [Phaeobacter sp. QD34_3]|uniref:NAD(P)/FAD-dependent oxidoreductase n=1 Tax=unclassified Phaeobacter TaxID=2621772 RepID=UPI00237F389C|nr:MULTISPECIES: FAD-dependent oxidoreductase [unclassified Phaeobacter]MDE4134848.1 FAD-dependent oxidoreductase [Phaeobacter sp. QD34_3]MDE4138478.1 FAD-dependent oxidoreductase [Phaeobacter sp. QD34_24]
MTTFDAIVIGGGIAGISAAAELARDMSVLVLEAEPQIGYHATGRSAAIFIRNYGNETLRALNAASALVLEAPEGITDRSLLSPRGEMLVADESELPALEDYATGATGLEQLTAQQAVELVPILRPERIAAAVIEWDAQDIDVDRMLAGYASALKRRGGQIVTKARIDTLTRMGGAWHVTVGTDSFNAPIVINAAGAWASDVGRMAGAMPIAISPLRRSAAILPAPDGYDPTRWPLFASAAEDWYAKPEAGKLMVSPADEDPVDPHDAWVDDMVLAEGLYRFEQAVTVPVTRVESSWAGLRSFAPDRSPVVGFDPLAEGFFWLAGQGGYGVQTAPALAALTAALCRGVAPAIGETITRAVSPQRFAG